MLRSSGWRHHGDGSPSRCKTSSFQWKIHHNNVILKGRKKKPFEPFGSSKTDRVSRFTSSTTDSDGSRSVQKLSGS